MTKFKSKIDPALLAFPVIVMVIVSGLMAFERIWLGLMIILIAAGFVIHLFVNTYYLVGNGSVNVRSGFIINIHIAIDSITEISRSRSILSAPALSLDRIKITYNSNDYIIISPEDKIGFVDQLIRLNPNIKTDIKT